MVDLMVNEQQSGTVGKDVPAGFKMTEVGVIPEDWVVISIDDCTTKVGSGKTPTGGASVYVDSGRPFVRSQNVDWGRLDLADVAYITDDIHNTFSGSEIQQDDVLLNITGASIGRCAKADFRIIGGNVNQHVCIIRTDAKKLSPSLLVELINSNYGQNQIDSYQAGGNREGLNFSQVKNLKFAIAPTPLEQTEIVRALSDINVFALDLENLIAKKQAIKTATMQQLLSGKTRLPQFALRKDGSVKGYKKSEVGDIPEDWHTSTILDIVTHIIDYRGRTPKKLGMDWGNGNIVALSAGNVKKGYIDFSSECYFGSDELYNRWMTSGIPKRNDIVFTMEAPLGNAALIPDDKKYILSQRTILLQINEEKFTPIFILQVLLSDFFQSYIYDCATGSTAQGIKRSVFEKLYIAAPKNREEQTAIAAILSDMDKDIQTLQQRLDKTRQLKQGMMQELLTGKTRLI